MPFYAVAKGNIVGVFDTWAECQTSINGFSGAKFKKFSVKEEADNFILNNQDAISSTPLPINQRLDNDDTQYIKVYTDGSCIRKNGKIYAGYGIYIPDLDIKQSHILIGDKTNNRGELSAIIESIKLFKDDKDKGIHIYTDSQYSIQIFTTTGEKYRLKNYKKSANIEYPNSDLIRELLRLKEDYIIKFTHINSHTGKEDIDSLGNDMADSLAVKGSVMDFIQNHENLGDNKLTFGKYKNQSIDTIGTTYLQWIKNDNKFENLCVKNEQLRLEKEIVIKYLENNRNYVS